MKDKVRLVVVYGSHDIRNMFERANRSCGKCYYKKYFASHRACPGSCGSLDNYFVKAIDINKHITIL